MKKITVVKALCTATLSNDFVCENRELLHQLFNGPTTVKNKLTQLKNRVTL